MEANIGLKKQLADLKLDAINDLFATTAEKYRKNGMDYIDYLAELVAEQSLRKQDRNINSKIKQAKFPHLKTLEAFDFSFNSSISKQKILNLAKLSFLQESENIVLIGPPGVGKTHIAIGLAIKAIYENQKAMFFTANDLKLALHQAYVTQKLQQYIQKLSRIPLLIIDELGYLPLSSQEANWFFQIIAQKYEHSSIIITSNKPFKEWGEIFQDQILATAILDRLLHHSHIFKLGGESYRMKDKAPIQSEEKSK